MALHKLTIHRFGGLNLYDDPVEEAGAVHATSLLNVDFDRGGRVYARDAHDEFASLNTLDGADALYPTHTTDGTGEVGGLLALSEVGANIQVDHINSDGTVTNVGTFAGGVPTSYTNIGSTTFAATYLASHNPGTGFTVQKFNGTVISGAGSGKPKFVAVSPRSNRLVQAGYAAAADTPSGANGTMSTVFFSNEGAPDTYTSTDFVVLTPGDGEEIIDMVSFRDLLFVFKQSRMFVFYSESVDDAGLVDFNYREVSLTDSIPYPQLGEHRVVVGDDAVYFSAAHGIYRTVGGTPDLISRDITPMYEGPGGAFVDEDINISPGAAPYLYWARGQLFGVYQTTAASHLVNSRVLVWSPLHGQWSLWHFDLNGTPTHFQDWPAQTANTDGSVMGTSAFFVVRNAGGGNSTPDDLFKIAPDSLTGVVDWHYQTGYYQLGDGEALTRHTDVFGSGDLDFSIQVIAGRAAAVSDVATTMDLGQAPAIGRERRSSAVRGRLFSHRFEGTNADVANPPRISKIEHYFAPGGRV